ncbi:hypothetical protein [Streptomyces sp. NBC_00356]|uniref:hypothetical protein n=1 Tax=Streptomyces sp. NBC_00356 TaxID=2975724 RepID=UPI002E2666F3
MTEMSKPLAEASELVRKFNHESRHLAAGWEFPGDAYSAVAELADLARKLGQAIDQSVRPVQTTSDAGRLTVDDGGDPDVAMVRVQNRRGQAVYAALRLSYALDELHSALSPLGARLPADS